VLHTLSSKAAPLDPTYLLSVSRKQAPQLVHLSLLVVELVILPKMAFQMVISLALMLLEDPRRTAMMLLSRLKPIKVEELPAIKVKLGHWILLSNVSATSSPQALKTLLLLILMSLGGMSGSGVPMVDLDLARWLATCMTSWVSF